MPQKERGEYLRKNLYFGQLSVAVARGVRAGAAVVGLLVLALVYAYVGWGLLFLACATLVCIGFVWVAVNLQPTIGTATSYNRRFASGIAGEDAVWRSFFGLPKGFTAYANVLLPSNTGDIDFVVVGPGGIYSVEVKNYEGRVEVIDGELWRGKQSLRFIVNQAMKEARSLSGFMTHIIGHRVYVHSLIVFTQNPGMYHPAKVQSCWVVPEHKLIKFISSGKANLSPLSLEAINNLLALMVKRA